MTRLRKEFCLGVYNLNYDTVALSALNGAFTGFDASGQFAPDDMANQMEWDFVYHLHGSVHQTLVGPFGEKLRWVDDLNAEFDDGHIGLSLDWRSDDRPFVRTTLVAGGFKLDQLLVEPYSSFHAALVRDVYSADAILIGGYGFGDEHVNRALQNAFVERDARRPALVVNWSPDDQDLTSSRATHGLDS